MKGWLILGVTFLIGVILGVTAATHGPALVAPYLPRAVARSQTRIDGQVVRKQRDGNRLLVKVDTGQGPMLVTFTQKVADAVLAFFERRQISQHQLGVNDLNVAGRIDRSRDMVNVTACKTTDDLHNRIDVANVTEKLIT